MYRPGKVFPISTLESIEDDEDQGAAGKLAKVLSMDCDQLGEYLLVSHGYGYLTVFDWDKGSRLGLKAQKHPLEVTLARFHCLNDRLCIAATLWSHDKPSSHPSWCLTDLVSATVVDSFFSGYKDQIVGLEMLPNSNYVLTASEDGTVRLWDARNSRNSIGRLCRSDAILLSERSSAEQTSNAAIAWDANTACFAVSSGAPVVRIFSLLYYSNGPFLTVKVHRLFDIATLRFSKDSSLLYCTSRSGYMVAIKTQDGSVAFELPCRMGLDVAVGCSALGDLIALPTTSGLGIYNAYTGAVVQIISTSLSITTNFSLGSAVKVEGVDFMQSAIWSPVFDAFASSGSHALAMWTNAPRSTSTQARSSTIDE